MVNIAKCIKNREMLIRSIVERMTVVYKNNLFQKIKKMIKMNRSYYKHNTSWSLRSI
jgi:hypothetical protein